VTVSTIQLAIQCISTQALRDAGDADVEWGTYEDLRDVDYTDYNSVDNAIGMLSLDEPGRYAYRIVEVASDEDSYLDLQAENLDALEAMTAWVAAGCPSRGRELLALERAAIGRAQAMPVKVASKAIEKKGRAA